MQEYYVEPRRSERESRTAAIIDILGGAGIGGVGGYGAGELGRAVMDNRANMAHQEYMASPEREAGVKRFTNIREGDLAEEKFRIFKDYQDKKARGFPGDEIGEMRVKKAYDQGMKDAKDSLRARLMNEVFDKDSEMMAKKMKTHKLAKKLPGMLGKAGTVAGGLGGLFLEGLDAEEVDPSQGRPPVDEEEWTQPGGNPAMSYDDRLAWEKEQEAIRELLIRRAAIEQMQNQGTPQLGGY